MLGLRQHARDETTFSGRGSGTRPGALLYPDFSRTSAVCRYDLYRSRISRT